MLIKTLPSKTSVYQIITDHFSGIGHIIEQTEVYTKLVPHTVEQVLKEYPETVFHDVYIPTQKITLIIELYAKSTL